MMVVIKKNGLAFRWGIGNAKLPGDTITFSLPAGWTCRGALLCLSRASRKTGKITDGKDAEFRCFAASEEARPTVRNARWHNLSLLRRLSSASAIEAALSEDMAVLCRRHVVRAVRVHPSGDFFSLEYLAAWNAVALAHPDLAIYCYTKALDLIGAIGTANLSLIVTASEGGRFDAAIPTLGLRTAHVVYGEEGLKLAHTHGWEVDHDDSRARSRTGGDFALLVHGTQPIGSDASKFARRLKSAGWTGYGREGEGKRIELPMLD